MVPGRRFGTGTREHFRPRPKVYLKCRSLLFDPSFRGLQTVVHTACLHQGLRRRRRPRTRPESESLQQAAEASLRLYTRLLVCSAACGCCCSRAIRSRPADVDACVSRRGRVELARARAAGRFLSGSLSLSVGQTCPRRTSACRPWFSVYTHNIYYTRIGLRLLGGKQNKAINKESKTN